MTRPPAIGTQSPVVRVLVAHPGVELYGSDQQMLRSAEAFTSAGWQVTVALPEHGELCGHLDGVDVRHVATPVLRKAWLTPLGLLRLAILSPLAVLRQLRAIRSAQPDVVLVNTVTLPHWILAARLARRRVVVHVHEAEESASRPMRFALYVPLLLAHAVVANSETTRRVIASTLAQLRGRTRVVFNGVADPGSRPTTDTVPGRLTVVSRLSPRKGVHDAIEAFRLLVETGRDLTLEICGTAFPGYEWYERQLHEAVAVAGVSERVSFPGFVLPVGAALGRAEVVLAPSHGESFGNSVVEAMLAARPVVASSVQGLAEVLTDGRTGILTGAGNAEALAAATARLLDDRCFARSLADAAREDALSRFSLGAYGTNLRRAIVDVRVVPDRGKPQDPLKSGRPVARDMASMAALPRRGGHRRAGCRPPNRQAGSAGERGVGAANGRVRLVARGLFGNARVGAAVVAAAGAVAVMASVTACTTSSPRTSSPATAAGSAGAGSAATPGGAKAAGTTAPSQRAATTPVPPPVPGDISHPVRGGSVVTHSPLPLGRSGSFASGVDVHVLQAEKIQARARRPGEISGPAVRLSVELTNRTNKPVSAAGLAVTCADARGTALVEFLSPPSHPFHGTVSAGALARAVYVFELGRGARTARNPLTFQLGNSSTKSIVQFYGSAS